MGDELSKKGPPDYNRVSLGEEWEVRYWTDKFGVTETELRAAVAAVGSQAENLSKHLRHPAKKAR